MSNAMEDTGENYAQIKREIDGIKNATVTLDNYKKFSDKILNKDSIIVSQIENFKNDYVRESSALKTRTDTEKFQSTLDNNYVDREVYEIQRRMLVTLSNAFSWKIIQSEMYNILFKKVIELIDDTNAYAIKRDALKEMREMESERNRVILESVSQMVDFTKEVVGNKFSLMDEKLNTSYRMISEQSRMERNEMFSAFKRLTQVIAKQTDSKIEVVQKTMPLEENGRDRKFLGQDSSEGLSDTNKRKEFPKKQNIKRPEVRDKTNDEIEDAFNDVGTEEDF